MRRMFTFLLTACLAIAGLAGEALATHGEVHGYCDGNKPIITEWPERYKNYHAECANGSIILVPDNELEPPPPFEHKVAPDDFYSWAYLQLNGKPMINPYRDIDPFVTMSTGRTLIPIRMVTEAMGGTAEWKGGQQQVTIRLRDKYMVMTIGKAEAIANGKAVTLDQPPILLRDRTLVPLRVVMEAFGAEVTWTQATRTVDIILNGVECAPAYCV